MPQVNACLNSPPKDVRVWD